ncbi:MAG: DMT family transporter [Methanocorpusculum sp.]|nr:DMT family transporter [Methanocorpusculum sp.]
MYTPFTKLISADAGLMMSVAFIFFGSAFGMSIVLLFGRKSKAIFDPKRHLRKKDAGILLGIILISMAAFTAAIIGFQQETAATSSILQNVGTVATVLFAALFLKEKIPKRLGVGVALIVLGSLALAVTNPETLSFSTGSLIIIGACLLLGVLYILMKLLSERNPIEITIIRGLIIGAAALIIAFCMGESLPSLPQALGLMVTGFIACGLCPLFLMYAQRHLGAAKAGAIYGIYPLLGVLLAIPILGEVPGASFIAALILFLPGMYFVIRKNSGETAAEAKQRDEPREDAKYLQSISEERKAGMRNHLTSFGFLLIAMFFVTMLIDLLSSGAGSADAAADFLSAGRFIPGLILGILTFIVGTILLILGKRVLTAVTFILAVPPIFSFVFTGNIPILTATAGIFAGIFALVLLTSKDPNKYAFAAVNGLIGAVFTSHLFNSTVCSIIIGIAAAVLIWLSFSCGTGKLHHSLSKHLTEDSEMTFEQCGAIIGFLLMAKSATTAVVYGYLSDPSFYNLDSVLSLGVIYACITAFVAVMLLFIGKRQMTAVYFFGSAVVVVLDLFCEGAFEYLPVIFPLVFAVMIISRGRTLILPTAFMIGDTFATLLYTQLEAFPEVQTAMLLLRIMSVVIVTYLSFAIISEKPKLPVF